MITVRKSEAAKLQGGNTETAASTARPEAVQHAGV